MVKVAPGAVTFGRTTDWSTDPHPALLESIRVGEDGSVRRRREGSNPPIYHRKETMVSADHRSSVELPEPIGEPTERGLKNRL